MCSSNALSDADSGAKLQQRQYIGFLSYRTLKVDPVVDMTIYDNNDNFVQFCTNAPFLACRADSIVRFCADFRKRLRKGLRNRVMHPALFQSLLRRSAVVASLVAVAITAPVGGRLAGVARPVARRTFRGNQPARALVAARRQPGLAHPDRQPVGAGGVRQPHLRQFAHARRPHADAGTADRDRRGNRQGRVGAPLQPVPQRRAAASRLVGVARGRSGNRQRLSLHGGRAAGVRVAGRQGAVGSIAHRRVRRRHHARRPHHLADHRRRQAHSQRADPGVGRSQSARQPLLRVRQEDRADDLDQLAAVASLRHQLLDADRRRPSTARARWSSAAPTACITR